MLWINGSYTRSYAVSIRKLRTDTRWCFQFINEQFFVRSRKSRDCAEAYRAYAAQEIQKIDAEIAEKGHLWMETRFIGELPNQYVSVVIHTPR